MTAPAKKRPEFRNINAFTDLTTYRLPPAGWVSILHRASGGLMFVLLPFVIWMFDASLKSELSFANLTDVFASGAWGIPGVLWKLVVLALVWGFVHHLIAGLRHLWMDVNHDATTKAFGHRSAIVTLASGTLITLALGAKLFGLY